MNEVLSIKPDKVKAGIDEMISSGILLKNGSLDSTILSNMSKLSTYTPSNIFPAQKATIHITDKCSLSCIYCMNERERKKSKSRKLQLGHWNSILKDIYSNGVKEVCFSGGEPLLRNDLPLLIHNAQDMGLIVSVITNGMHISSNIINILKNNVRITVSLDSYNKEDNDRNRGAGAYDKTIDFVDTLNSNNIEFSINSVLTKYTIDTFYDCANALRKTYGMLRSISPIPQECAYIDHNESMYSVAQYEKFMDRLFTICQKEENRIYKIDCSSLKILGLKTGCGVAKTEFMIGPDGAIYPCRALYRNRFKGSYLDGTNFKDVWESDTILNELRKADSSRLNDCLQEGCDFWYFCAGGCFAQTYEICGELRSYPSSIECHKLKVRTAKKILLALQAKEANRSD